MRHHYLDIETEFYQAIERKEMKFVFVKNDLLFNEYDIIHLQEVVQGIKTGRKMEHLSLVFIMRGGKEGLSKEYCILNW